MKLLDCRLINSHPDVIRNIFVSALLRNYMNADLNDNKPIKDLKKMFSDLDIKNSIKSIFYDGRFISTPEDNNGLILRYLEYGGEGIKASNLISNTLFEIKKELGVDEFGD